MQEFIAQNEFLQILLCFSFEFRKYTFIKYCFANIPETEFRKIFFPFIFLKHVIFINNKTFKLYIFENLKDFAGTLSILT